MGSAHILLLVPGVHQRTLLLDTEASGQILPRRQDRLADLGQVTPGTGDVVEETSQHQQ